jgi:hypothetical protein
MELPTFSQSLFSSVETFSVILGWPGFPELGDSFCDLELSFALEGHGNSRILST